MYKFYDVAKMPTPTKTDLVNALDELTKAQADLAHCRADLLDKIVKMYCPYQVGDRMVITLRKTGEKHIAKIKSISWDTVCGDYAYMFKTKLKGKRRYVPSGHVTDMMPI